MCKSTLRLTESSLTDKPLSSLLLVSVQRLVDPVTQQPRMSLVTGEGISGTGRLSESYERLMMNSQGNEAGPYGHPRLSTSGRTSMSHGGRGAGGNNEYWAAAAGGARHSRRESGGSVLFNAYDNQDAIDLHQFSEEPDEEEEGESSVGEPYPPSPQSSRPHPTQPGGAGAANPQSHRRSASLKSVVGTNGKVVANGHSSLGAVKNNSIPK